MQLHAVTTMGAVDRYILHVGSFIIYVMMAMGAVGHYILYVVRAKGLLVITFSTL